VNRRQRAERYDRRVGDALILSCEEDVAGAQALLDGVKKDVIDDRTAWARFQYLIAACVTIAIATLSAAIVLNSFDCLTASGCVLRPPARSLGASSIAGMGGAFFSIAIALRGRTVLTDLHMWTNTMDAALRVVIGGIAAVVLVALVHLKAVDFTLGTRLPEWLFFLVVAFLAGFSERLVPDLLSKLSPEEAKKAAAAGAPAPAVAPTGGAAGGAAAAGRAGGAAPPATPPRPPTDAASGIDHCVCDIALTPGEVTKDSELPPATGGVAAPRP
jgi:hypothetical protein